MVKNGAWRYSGSAIGHSFKTKEAKMNEILK